MLLKYLLEAEGNSRTINSLILLFILIGLFAVPYDWIVHAVRIVALTGACYYGWYHYGDKVVSYLKGESDGFEEHSSPDTGDTDSDTQEA